LREQASLLISHGHAEARRYPLPLLHAETRIARKRDNRALATEASLTQLAVMSVLSKEAGKDLGKRLQDLQKD
jgi:hypothetical protein